MNGSWFIDVLQMLSATLWVTVAVSRAPALYRILTDRTPAWIDFFAAILVGNGLVQLGFVLRWWLYPSAKLSMQTGELTLWGCLYVASALIAGFSHRLPRHG